jgi:hypothetical protein
MTELAARRLVTSVCGVVLVGCALLAGCENRVATPDAGAIEPSPNASILPAPLATGREAPQALAAEDAGVSDAGPDAELPPPALSREDLAFPPDRDEQRDPSGVSLRARFRWLDVTPPARQPEANLDAIERARTASSFDVTVDLAAMGRLTFKLASRRFLLPEGTEFRARSDIYGHAVLWPDTDRYAVIQAGALRSVLNERRADTMPLASVKPAASGTGRVLGYASERTRVTTPLGTLDLEQAHVPNSGAGGPLLCRLLLEVAGAHPESSACTTDLIPLRAEYAWTQAGKLAFEVNALTPVSAFETRELRVPPASAQHRIGELPLQASPLLIERGQLRALRFKAIPGPEPRDAPRSGLLVSNGDDLPRYLLLDGVPVVQLAARAPGIQLDVVRGSYVVSTRSFLNDDVDAPVVVTAPGRVVVREGTKADL